MNKRNFYSVSIRGMVAFCTMCLENYVLEAYPERDLSPVLGLAWDVVGSEGFIDQNADRFMEAIPSRLFASPAKNYGLPPQTAPKSAAGRRPSPNHDCSRRSSYDDGSHQRHHEQSTPTRGRER